MLAEPELASAFLSQLDDDARERAGSITGLADLLAGVRERALAAWPELDEPPQFVAYLAERFARQSDSLTVWFERAPADDLLVACACLAGQDRAIEILERDFLARVMPAVGRLGADRSQEEEIRQRVLAALLVADAGAPPALDNYNGRGGLVSWLRVVVIRVGLKHLAENRRLATEDAALAAIADLEDPELAHMRTRHRREFAVAFEHGVAALAADQRTLLRQHHLDGLSIDKLGALHGVHRATAARWLHRARDQLFRNTRDHLRRNLKVSAEEFDSIVRLVRSQLEVTLHRILGGR